METRQAIETPIAEEVLRDDAHTATQMSFGWKFESLPLEEAMRLARASRMDEGEYSMLREQLTRLVEDKSASIRITPPPPCRTRKPGITVSRSRRISAWLSLSGEHQVDRSSVGKPRRRKLRCEKNVAQRFSIEEHRRPRRRARHRAGGQNASALPRKRRWFDAASGRGKSPIA